MCFVLKVGIISSSKAMAGNSFGKILTLSTFGESHGVAIGGVLDGVPAGVKIELEEIQNQLDRRKPGQSNLTTQRKESDTVEVLSGTIDGVTTGMPIGFLIRNTNQKTKDYDHLKDVFRPSHADYTYQKKFGVRDHRGGGRSSARETACRIVGGSISKFILPNSMKITAYVSQVGSIKIPEDETLLDFDFIEKNPVRCPHKATALSIEHLIKSVRKSGDSVGGVISCRIKNVPLGLGEPVFDRLDADLAKSMLSINAVKGFEYGSGFGGALLKGSQHNDLILANGRTATNFSGGIQGGISNGEDIYFRVAFKPTATIMQKQDSITSDFSPTIVEGRGRHDPCVLPRAVPIVEAMALLTLADHYLINKMRRQNSV